MKISLLSIVLFMSITMINCTKDETSTPKSVPEESTNPEEPEEPEIEIYFTYTGALGEEIDEWIMVYNQNGDLLDSKLIEKGETYEFIGKNASNQVSDKITVTRLTSRSDKVNSFLTFTNISKGSIWNLPPENTDVNLPTIGKFNISVENAPSYKNFTLSTSLGTVLNNNLDSIETMNIPQISSLQLNGVPLFENQDYLLSFFSLQGEHRYVYLKNPTSNMQYNFNYDELLMFDGYLEVDFPNYTSRSIIRGYKEPLNYRNNTTILGDANGFGSSPYQVGYSNIFEKFKTSVFMDIDGNEYTYIKMGDKLDEINVPFTPLVEIGNNTVYDFEFSSDQNFVRKSAKWISTAIFPNIIPTTTWTVISSNSKSHDVPMPPAKILDQYPDLKLGELKLFSLQLFIQAGEYQSYFNSYFETYIITEEAIQESFTYYYEQ